ncbi:hypothetical protein FHY11_000359 [Xanthomonas arboricola]|uniref:hypothetical protein n=1 Tax=Xanthomonas euroxanthea TaxID=2259622 RepID=UPI002DD64A4A|nr:hypothetical protein [Xanthomonas euroxanthea]NIK06893.1 hypothetical protein [Xanthomonas euroxanthea]
MNAQWMAAVADALSDLQAARVARGAVLEAVRASHPAPASLTGCQDRLSSSLMATVAQRKALSAAAKPVEVYTLEQLAAWNDRIERCVPQARTQSQACSLLGCADRARARHLAGRHPAFGVVIRGALIGKGDASRLAAVQGDAAGPGNQKLRQELSIARNAVGSEQIIAHVPNCGDAQ